MVFSGGKAERDCYNFALQQQRGGQQGFWYCAATEKDNCKLKLAGIVVLGNTSFETQVLIILRLKIKQEEQRK